MTTEICIAPFCAHHVSDVAEIEVMLNTEPWSQQLFADELTLSGTSRHWLVALSGTEVVGFAGSMFVETDAHLMNIGVKPSHQRRGIARQLMSHMLRDVRQAGYLNFTLEVRPNNLAAMALYRTFGLAPVGVRKKYYPDGQDALIMWVHHIDSATYGDHLNRISLPC